MIRQKRLKRRQFSVLVVASTVIPLAAVISSLTRVAEAASVKESAPHAKALRYARKSVKAGQNCGNCTLYQASAGGSTGLCPLFSGETVNRLAWCSAWVPRA